MKQDQNPIPQLIVERLADAAMAAGAVEKLSRNDFANYNYASETDLLLHCCPFLYKYKVWLQRIGWHPERWLVTPDGEPKMHEGVVYQLTALDQSAVPPWVSEPLQWPIVPTKGRTDDKATGSALTDCLKYFLCGILLLPRANAADMDSRDDEMDQREDSAARGQHIKRAPKAKQAERSTSDGRI